MKTSKKLLAGLMFSSLAAVSTSAMAAGFQLTEQSVVSMGRSHAGAGIVGDDVSAVWYNPAGMTLLPGTQFQISSTIVDLDIDYKGLDGSRENGRDKPAPIPAFFVSHQITDNLWAGLAITSPYGMKIRYGSDWTERERGISGSIMTVDINPNIAWKATEWFSIGAGVSAMYTHSKIKNGLPIVPVGQADVTGGEFEYKGSDWMFTYNAGIMLSPLETLRFGISYRSAAHVHAKGDYTVRGNLGPMGLSQTNYGYGDLTTPETVMITGTWETTPWLRLSALARWANWKNFKDMRFYTNANDGIYSMLSPQMSSKLTHMTLENNWKSVWLLSLGADIKVNNQWTIRGGIALETDPIHDQTKRTALIPDTKRLWLTCGVSWAPTKNWQIDAAYGHIRGIGHRKLYSHNAVTDAYTEVGKFEKMNAWMGGLQVQYKF